MGVRKQRQERSMMTGEYHTITCMDATLPVADLATTMQNLMKRFEQQDTSNKENSKHLYALTACTQPATYEQDHETMRRQLFRTNINMTGIRTATTQADQITT